MSGDRIRGMDVSHWTGLVNWRQAKERSGINFGIVKATQGDRYIDDTFDTNWTALRRENMIRGAYHFFEPKVDPVAQADHFWSVAGAVLHSSDIPPALDIEYYPAYIRQEYDAFPVNQRLKRIQACLERLEALAGRKPVVYTSQSSWRAITGDTQACCDYPLWVANYGVQEPFVPAGNWGGKGWWIWQYTGSGSVAGATASVDLNWYNGPLKKLQEFLRLVEARPLPPQTTNGRLLEAFERAAEALDVSVETLLERAGVGHIAAGDAADRPYDGPALEEMGLTKKQQKAVKKALEALEPAAPAGVPAGFTNQDMINAFYNAAAKLYLDGWTLIAKAGLLSMADRRAELYDGPPAEDLPLSEGERAALVEALGGKRGPMPPIYPYPRLTNQDMINAFYRAAERVGGDYWDWVTRAGLASIAANRSALYAGPVVDRLPLEPEQIKALRKEVGVEPQETVAGPPYPDLTNQNMIDIFFRAAELYDQDYWDWITRAKLTHMAIPTENRGRLYTGPRVEDLPGLKPREKRTLRLVMGL